MAALFTRALIAPQFALGSFEESNDIFFTGNICLDRTRAAMPADTICSAIAPCFGLTGGKVDRHRISACTRQFCDRCADSATRAGHDECALVAQHRFISWTKGQFSKAQNIAPEGAGEHRRKRV